MEMHSLRRDSGESPETLQKSCVSKKKPHQEIRWNFGILYSEIDCFVYYDFRVLNASNVVERYSYGVANAEVRWTCHRSIFGTKNVKCYTDIWTGNTNDFIIT